LSDPASPGEDRAERGASAEQRLAEVVAAYRALQAENESYRERVSRNAERRFAQRHERLLLKFIDILDNLDRALDASELTHTGGSMIEGLILVRTQLLQTLQEEGLERIPVVGIPYDPEVAEAVGTQPVDDPDHHHVVMKDIRRGYRLNGKLARAAQVIVGEYAGELPEPEPVEPPPEDSGRVEVVSDGGENTGQIAALAAQAAAAIEAGHGGRHDTDGTATSGDEVLHGTDGEVLHEEDDDGLIGEVDLEAAAREAAAMAGDEEEANVPAFETDAVTPEDPAVDAEIGGDDLEADIDLEAAAREAAAMAEGEETGDAYLDDSETPLEDEDAAVEQGTGDVLGDEDSLEQAAREAAALVGEDEPSFEPADEQEATEPGRELELEAEPESDPELEPAPEPLEAAGAEPPTQESDAERKPKLPPLHPLDDVDPSAFDDDANG